MKFEDLGLPKDPLVEKAFDYAQSYTAGLQREMKENILESIAFDYQDQIEELEEALEFEDIDQDDYKDWKREIDEEHARNVDAVTPEIVSEALTRLFIDNYVGPALEIQQYSDKASNALVAAAMLVDCVRDPVDCAKVEKTFGPAIAALAAELLHINAYQADREENMTHASPDAKRLMLAQLTNILRKTVTSLSKAPDDEGAYMPLEEAKTAFVNARYLSGNDKKLDARMISIFNSAAALMESPFRLEVGEKGELELTKTVQKKPAAPSKKKTPPTFGDDGF